MAKKKSSKLTLWWRRMKRRRAKAKANQTKKIRKMDVILAFIILAGVRFTTEMINLYKETGATPEVLITCVFAALFGECGAMALIKATEERRQDRKWIREDQDREERLQKEAEKTEE